MHLTTQISVFIISNLTWEAATPRFWWGQNKNTMVLFLRICWKKLFQHHITQISTGLHQFSSITLSNFKLVFFNFFNQDSSLSAYFLRWGNILGWYNQALGSEWPSFNHVWPIMPLKQLSFICLWDLTNRFGLCHWLTQPLCQGRARLRLFLIIKINKIMLQAYFGFKW